MLQNTEWDENRGQGRDKGKGFTLLEVMLALVIFGIILTVALQLTIGEWRGAKSLKGRLEVQYSVLTAGKTVSDAIRSAQSVQWAAPAVLKVLPWPDEGTTEVTTDLYYVDDKDRDGVKDLYCEHRKVPNPVASRITFWQATEVEPGLWEIMIKAGSGEQEAVWRGMIRQRTYSAAVAGEKENSKMVLRHSLSYYCWSPYLYLVWNHI